MTITMYDAVTAANIPADAKYAAFYTDGRFANGTAVKARAPHATYLSITVLGGAADCVDCEQGDLTVAQGIAWIEQRLAAGAHRPCIYANLDRFENQGLLAGLSKHGNKIRRWVAHFDGVAQLPAGYDAKQFSTDPNLDTSVCADDFFAPAAKPTKAPAVHQWSAELQVSIPAGSSGKLHFHGALDLKSGEWTAGGLPGLVHWSGPGGGKWRIKGIELDAPPLGK